jgi:SAM-dependent methyltransferase
MLWGVSDLRERWRSGWFEATLYDVVVERERVARPLARLIWGAQMSAFYAELARLAQEPDGSRILDVPCGGGVAFRGLRPDQHVHYVAADLSTVMLGRARQEAQRRRLSQVEFVEADVEGLPFDHESFDLCITYAGLHCFGDPAAAVGEFVRVLTPRGRLRGTSVVTGAGARYEALIGLAQRRSIFGEVLSASELESLLKRSGLEGVRVRLDGALVYFEARRWGEDQGPTVT